MTNIAEIPKDLQTFIEIIAGDINTPITFQTFSDKPGKKAIAEIHHGTVGSLFPRFLTANHKGSGIFLMVNEGDQKGRKSENVIRIRVLFADFDGADHQEALELLKPHLVVETSPGKFHLYWLVADCQTNEFSSIQKSIASRFGSDPSVHDLARVMRLPGFLHQKTDAPFEVRLVDYVDASPYSKEQIINSLGLQIPLDEQPSQPRSHFRTVDNSQDFEIVDGNTGEIFNLKHWALECPDFLIADALRKHRTEVALGQPREGRQHIRCPFHNEHTNKLDDNATFCINGDESETNGFVIKCLHAHCSDRDRIDFIRKLLILGWLPRSVLTNPVFLKEKHRPKWLRYPLDDLHRSEGFRSLEKHEQGIFLHFRELSWTMGDGRLEDSNWKLARLLGIEESKWESYRETCLRVGLLRSENGFLIHDASLEIYRTSQNAYERSARAGRRGGKSGSNKE